MKEKQILLSHLQFVPNRGASHLESTLGITFLQKPHAAPLNSHNINILANSGKLGKDVVENAWHIAGRYIDNLHIYFFREEGKNPFLTHLHENFHGYHILMDPKHSKRLGAFSRITDPKMVIDFVIFNTFEEGLAEWAAVEALHRSLNPNDQAIAQFQRDNLLFGIQYKDGFVSDTEAPGDQAFSFIAQYIEDAQQEIKKQRRTKRLLFPSNMEDLSRYSQGFWDVIRHKSYYVGGYNFVYYALHELVDTYGFHLDQAINALIINPPKTMGDLSNPREFVIRTFISERKPTERLEKSSLL